MPFAMLALSVLSALVLALTGAQALVAQGSFRIEELRRSTERLERGYGVLRLEAAQLGSPERIERWARHAGLVLPDPDDLRVVVIETRTPGTADPAVTPALAAGASGG